MFQPRRNHKIESRSVDGVKSQYLSCQAGGFFMGAPIAAGPHGREENGHFAWKLLHSILDDRIILLRALIPPGVLRGIEPGWCMTRVVLQAFQHGIEDFLRRVVVPVLLHQGCLTTNNHGDFRAFFRVLHTTRLQVVAPIIYCVLGHIIFLGGQGTQADFFGEADYLGAF